MKNFDWTKFTRKIAVKAPIETVYKAWTRPEELEKWFLSDATYRNDEGSKISKDQNIKGGYSYEWQWYLYPETEHGKVIDTNGKDHIQFTFAGDCRVDIDLKTFEDKTIVTLSQKNIPTDDKSKVTVRLGCDKGWSFYLVNLKSVYEGGLDLRNKDPKIGSVLNS